MTTIEYMHSTSGGTYLVSCKVLSRQNDRFEIEFFDNVEGCYSTRWVEKSSLIFPKFSEYATV